MKADRNSRRRVLTALGRTTVVLAVSRSALAADSKAEGKGICATIEKGKPMVKLETNVGTITLELDAEKAPKTVANFLHYVEKGFYDGTIFHRVIDGFMIQGGGFTPGMQQKPTDPPIENEAGNGLLNKAYTIAMARTPNPHSASSQFFINVRDNAALNFSSPTPQGFGYCVFGHVVEGRDVVDRIKGVSTGPRDGHRDVPTEDVVIQKASVC